MDLSAKCRIADQVQPAKHQGRHSAQDSLSPPSGPPSKLRSFDPPSSTGNGHKKSWIPPSSSTMEWQSRPWPRHVRTQARQYWNTCTSEQFLCATLKNSIEMMKKNRKDEIQNSQDSHLKSMKYRLKVNHNTVPWNALKT